MLLRSLPPYALPPPLPFVIAACLLAFDISLFSLFSSLFHYDAIFFSLFSFRYYYGFRFHFLFFRCRRRFWLRFLCWCFAMIDFAFRHAIFAIADFLAALLITLSLFIATASPHAHCFFFHYFFCAFHYWYFLRWYFAFFLIITLISADTDFLLFRCFAFCFHYFFFIIIFDADYFRFFFFFAASAMLMFRLILPSSLSPFSSFRHFIFRFTYFHYLFFLICRHAMISLCHSDACRFAFRCCHYAAADVTLWFLWLLMLSFFIDYWRLFASSPLMPFLIDIIYSFRHDTDFLSLLIRCHYATAAAIIDVIDFRFAPPCWYAIAFSHIDAFRRCLFCRLYVIISLPYAFRLFCHKAFFIITFSLPLSLSLFSPFLSMLFALFSFWCCCHYAVTPLLMLLPLSLRHFAFDFRRCCWFRFSFAAPLIFRWFSSSLFAIFMPCFLSRQIARLISSAFAIAAIFAWYAAERLIRWCLSPLLFFIISLICWCHIFMLMLFSPCLFSLIDAALPLSPSFRYFSSLFASLRHFASAAFATLMLPPLLLMPLSILFRFRHATMLMLPPPFYFRCWWCLIFFDAFFSPLLWCHFFITLPLPVTPPPSSMLFSLLGVWRRSCCFRAATLRFMPLIAAPQAAMPFDTMMFSCHADYAATALQLDYALYIIITRYVAAIDAAIMLLRYAMLPPRHSWYAVAVAHQHEHDDHIDVMPLMLSLSIVTRYAAICYFHAFRYFRHHVVNESRFFMMPFFFHAMICWCCLMMLPFSPLFSRCCSFRHCWCRRQLLIDASTFSLRHADYAFFRHVAAIFARHAHTATLLLDIDVMSPRHGEYHHRRRFAHQPLIRWCSCRYFRCRDAIFAAYAAIFLLLTPCCCCCFSPIFVFFTPLMLMLTLLMLLLRFRWCWAVAAAFAAILPPLIFTYAASLILIIAVTPLLLMPPPISLLLSMLSLSLSRFFFHFRFFAPLRSIFLWCCCASSLRLHHVTSASIHADIRCYAMLRWLLPLFFRHLLICLICCHAIAATRRYAILPCFIFDMLIYAMSRYLFRLRLFIACVWCWCFFTCYYATFFAIFRYIRATLFASYLILLLPFIAFDYHVTFRLFRLFSIFDYAIFFARRIDIAAIFADDYYADTLLAPLLLLFFFHAFSPLPYYYWLGFHYADTQLPACYAAYIRHTTPPHAAMLFDALMPLLRYAIAFRHVTFAVRHCRRHY